LSDYTTEVKEIKSPVRALPIEDLTEFRECFDEYANELWDQPNC